MSGTTARILAGTYSPSQSAANGAEGGTNKFSVVGADLGGAVMEGSYAVCKLLENNGGEGGHSTSYNVGWHTFNGTATSPKDYTAMSGVYKFNTDVSVLSVIVPTNPNRHVEHSYSPNEDFGVKIDNITVANGGEGISTTQTSARECFREFTINSPSVTEPSGSQTVDANFTVTMTPAVPGQTYNAYDYHFSDLNGASSEVTRQNLPYLTFPPGQSTITVPLVVHHDGVALHLGSSQSFLDGMTLSGNVETVGLSSGYLRIYNGFGPQHDTRPGRRRGNSIRQGLFRIQFNPSWHAVRHWHDSARQQCEQPHQQQHDERIIDGRTRHHDSR